MADNTTNTIDVVETIEAVETIPVESSSHSVVKAVAIGATFLATAIGGCYFIVKKLKDRNSLSDFDDDFYEDYEEDEDIPVEEQAK